MIARLVTRFPLLSASLFYALAVCLAFNRFFTGLVLLPPLSDQRDGYPPRLFAAEHLKELGSLPEWSPYIFGGFPFISNTGFGDTFFPTALLRLILPVDVGMALAMIVFVFLAGVFTFLFLRTLGLSWGAAFVGGAAYMFSGMVISMVSPGHDGKLYVSAMLPLALMFLYKGTSKGDWHQYLYFGAVVGLSLLTPHFQATYFLLMASGFFWFFMVFLSQEKSEGEPWWRSSLLFVGALIIGFAVAAVQLLPFIEYLPYSARAAPDSGSAGNWIYATSYSLPPEEILGFFLSGFNSSSLDNYYGQNPLKLHSDYLGAVTGLLALASFSFLPRRRMWWFFLFLAVYALLFAMGAHTPFYGIPYTVLPFISKTRAPAIILFLASFSVAVFAAFGTEYLLGKAEEVGQAARRAVKKTTSWITEIDRKLLYGFVALVFLAVLAASGGLRPIADSIAEIRPVGMSLEAHQEVLLGRLTVAANNYDLFVRQILMAVILGTGAVALLIPSNTRRLGRETVALYLGLIVLTDLWLLERNYIRFSPRAAVLFAPDEVVAALKADTTLHRVMPITNPFLDPRRDAGRANPYMGNYFMAHRVRTALGYNGFEIHAYDQLLGGKNSWGAPWQSTTMVPRLWQLLGVRYVVLPEPFPRADSLAQWGMEGIAPLVQDFWSNLEPTGAELRTYTGGTASVYRVTNPLPFAFLVPVAWRVSADVESILATILPPQFDPRTLLIVPAGSPAGRDSVAALGVPIQNAVRSLEERPGKLRFELERPADNDAFLYVAENFYPAWEAKVDGASAPVIKAQVSLIAVPIAAGARTVELEFSLASYHLGRLITLATLLMVLLIAAIAVVQHRTQKQTPKKRE